MPDPLDLLLRNLQRLNAATAVGAHDEENARKLAYSEFGSAVEPSQTREGAVIRPTLSAVTDRSERAISAAIDRKVAAVLDGKTRTGVAIMQDVGADLAEMVREEIGNNTPPPLAPSTVASRRRRGKDERTLVDSGDMQVSIRAETRDGENVWPDEE